MQSQVTGTLETLACAVEATQPALMATSEGKTRAQVRAELAEAIRTGDIVTGKAGLRLRDQVPDRCPRSSIRTTQAETRAVQAR